MIKLSPRPRKGNTNFWFHVSLDLTVVFNRFNNNNNVDDDKDTYLAFDLRKSIRQNPFSTLLVMVSLRFSPTI